MDPKTLDRFAKSILIAFACVGLLHVPAFYAVLYVLANEKSPATIEACPVTRGVK